VSLKRVILHWTAGTHVANALDRQHYHFMVQGDGSVVEGVHPPEDNERLVGADYAAHTLNCNTGSIGVALCGMLGAVESPFTAGIYPINETQLTAACALVARLCKTYGIAVTPKTVLTHAEVQGTLAIVQNGKWDIARLPWTSTIVGATAVGGFIRALVAGSATSPSTSTLEERVAALEAAVAVLRASATQPKGA
jgi:N-acetyl-anhydromuramyl-L-alanine amidase AmpD